jgi:hypothetical protein
MTRERWYESDDPGRVARGASLRIALWVIAVILFCGLIGIATWGFTVATSDVKGRGDATRQVNSGVNRLAQQAYFEQTYADIKAADLNLDLPGNDVEKAGRTAYCRRLVADYNAAARQQIAAKFRAADLPPQIDQTDPATDCRPNGALATP